MKCNHEKCETAYCPHCGTPVVSSAEARTREYFLKNVRKCDAIVQKSTAKLDKPPERTWDTRAHREANLRCQTKTLECWQRRLDDFEEALRQRSNA